MDIAFNKRTREFVNAFRIYNDGAYQNIDPKEWIAPSDEICNWDELEKLNINEVPVSYRKPSRRIINGENKIIRAPCFAKLKGHIGITKSGGESKEHRLLKNFIIERIIDDDITFCYSETIGKSKSTNKFKLSELSVDIYNCQIDPEKTIQSTCKTRADILLPFIKPHKLLGNGIIIEIQLSNQADVTTTNRTIKRGIQGYSVAWIFENDFEEIEECIFLKNNEIKLSSRTEIINENFPDKMERLTEDHCRFLNDKVKDFENCKSDIDLLVKRKLGELYIEGEKIENSYNEKIKEIQNIWGSFNKKINTLTEDVIKNKIDISINDLYEKLSSKIKNNISITLKEQELNINEKIKELYDSEINNFISEVIDKSIKNNITNIVDNLNLKDIFIENERIISAKKCPLCGDIMKIGKAMSGHNWYCEKFPRCDGMIKGSDKSNEN